MPAVMRRSWPRVGRGCVCCRQASRECVAGPAVRPCRGLPPGAPNGAGPRTPAGRTARPTAPSGRRRPLVRVPGSAPLPRVLRCGQPVGHECCRTVGRVRAAIAGATSAIAAVKAMSSPSSPICRPPKDRTSTRRTRHDVHPIPRATVHDRPGSGCVAMACRSPGHRRGPISRAGIVLMNVASSTPRSPEERVVLALQRPRPAGDCPHRPSPVKSTARMPPPVVGDVLGGTVVYLLLLFMTRAVLRLIRASAQV